MRSTNSIFLVLLFATLGLWGCAEAPQDPTAAAQTRVLKARAAKLEEDYRATVAECLRLRTKLTSSEAETVQVRQERDQLQEMVRERDDLRHQVTVLQTERDGLQGQLASFNRELQSLAGKFGQAAASRPGQPLVSTVSRQVQK